MIKILRILSKLLDNNTWAKQKFCSITVSAICGTYTMWPKPFKPWKVVAVLGSIAVVGVLICCALLHSVCDLKVTQMNMQRSLIREFMLYKFELDPNATEVTQNICYTKVESAVDHCRVTRGFKKFCLAYKNLEDQARQGRRKTMDSEAKSLTQIRRVAPGEYQASSASYSSVWFVICTTAAQLCLMLLKYC